MIVLDVEHFGMALCRVTPHRAVVDQQGQLSASQLPLNNLRYVRIRPLGACDRDTINMFYGEKKADGNSRTGKRVNLRNARVL